MTTTPLLSLKEPGNCFAHGQTERPNIYNKTSILDSNNTIRNYFNSASSLILLQSSNMDMSKHQFGASSSSSSSSSPHLFTHDVFLSFRGADTRNNFTGHLYSNLVNKGINTFVDDGLLKGEDISQELLEVIEGSRISVVVFSANYTSSKWCLNELVKIFQCKEFKQQIVYPIFYKVDPSMIRYQKGQVGEAFAHLSQYKDNFEKVENWKAALRKAATLSGWHISDGGHEANIIDEIVKEISTQIMKCNPLHVATYPVGIKSRVEDILKLLNVGEYDPHMIGIWGIGGIGKTTLAKAVYNSISHKFEHNCFLANVRQESFSYGGLVKLQNNFLSKIIERNPPNVTNVDEGITVLKQKLGQKRVLLVLDDVDDLDQLRKLAGGCDWFGPRSRIIITTRYTKYLSAHQVNSLYGVKELNDQEALELFNFSAFKRNTCSDDFFELAIEVIRYAKGIPLVLEVLGSDLCSKNDKDEWKGAIEYYSRYPNQDIQQVLKRSYKALPDLMKEVFLHISCFFKGDEKSYVMDVLQRYDEQSRTEESKTKCACQTSYATSAQDGPGYYSEESRRIQCTKCGNSHIWVCTNRSKTKARWCQDCCQYHQAKDGDGWVEYKGSIVFDRPQKAELPRAFVCAESKIYDVSEWGICQGMSCRANTHRPSFHVNMAGLEKTQISYSSRFPWDLDAEIMDEDGEEFELWLQQALASGLFRESSKRRNSWTPFKFHQLGKNQW